MAQCQKLAISETFTTFALSLYNLQKALTSKVGLVPKNSLLDQNCGFSTKFRVFVQFLYWLANFWWIERRTNLIFPESLIREVET